MININFSDHFIEADDTPFKGSTAPMVNLDIYAFKGLNKGKITPQ